MCCIFCKKCGRELEYICLEPGVTKQLYPDTIRLYNVKNGNDISIQSKCFSAGRNWKCELKLKDRAASRVHATFYYEEPTWYLMDHDSKNGTWINDVKLEPGKKYELCADDKITFPRAESFVFFKSEPSVLSEDTGKFSEERKAVMAEKKDLLGTVIEKKYQIINYIGYFGSTPLRVCLAKNIRTDKKLVMKVFDKTADRFSNIYRNMIFQEINMMKELKHPAIPSIIDVIEDENYLFVVREYVEGNTLEHELKMLADGNSVLREYLIGRTFEEVVVDWAKQLCDVLHYLHTLNPPHIYQDIKPSNIVLTSEGQIKLIEFGTMLTYKQGILPLANAGYAAPEQYGGKTDARTDIYSLGATLYHLVTGQNPCTYQYGIFPFQEYPICYWNPELSKGLEYIINKCTMQHPDDRYQTCAELLADLNQYEKMPQII